MEINTNLNDKDYVMDASHLDADFKKQYVANLMSGFTESEEFAENSINEIYKERRIKVVHTPTGKEFTDWEQIPDAYGHSAVLGMLSLKVSLVEDENAEENPFAEFTNPTLTYQIKSPLSDDKWFLTLEKQTNALRAKYYGFKIKYNSDDSNKYLRNQIEALVNHRIKLFVEICKDKHGYTKDVPVQHILEVMDKHFKIENKGK